MNPERVIECSPKSDFDHVEQNNVTDLFSIFIAPEVVFDYDKSEFRCQNYLRRKIFSESILKNMAEFIKMGCTQRTLVLE